MYRFQIAERKSPVQFVIQLIVLHEADQQAVILGGEYLLLWRQFINTHGSHRLCRSRHRLTHLHQSVEFVPVNRVELPLPDLQVQTYRPHNTFSEVYKEQRMIGKIIVPVKMLQCLCKCLIIPVLFIEIRVPAVNVLGISAVLRIEERGNEAYNIADSVILGFRRYEPGQSVYEQLCLPQESEPVLELFVKPVIPAAGIRITAFRCQRDPLSVGFANVAEEFGTAVIQNACHAITIPSKPIRDNSAVFPIQITSKTE